MVLPESKETALALVLWTYALLGGRLTALVFAVLLTLDAVGWLE